MGRIIALASAVLLLASAACTTRVHQPPMSTATAASVPAQSPVARRPHRPVPNGSPVHPATRNHAVRQTAATTAGCGSPFTPGDTEQSIMTGGNSRNFLLHVPPGYDPSKPYPVVFSYSGYNRSASNQHDYTALWVVADRAGFILVEPEGWGDPQEWDIYGDYYYDGIDDLAFTTDILQNVESQLCVDTTRVYATGFSNGAEMASLVGCRLGDVFAAVAPVSGVEYDGDCVGRAVPVLSLQGTDDWNVPYEDAPPAMAAWADHNGCSATQDTSQLTDSVSVESYEGCSADAVLYVIDGGGHTWPGASDDAGDIGGVGFTTHEIDANDVIWHFFTAHTLGS